MNTHTTPPTTTKDTIETRGRAIRTRFLPCTNHKSHRVKAWLCDDLKPLAEVTISWSYDLPQSKDNHEQAALACLEKLRKLDYGHFFSQELIGSYLGNGEYAFSLKEIA